MVVFISRIIKYLLFIISKDKNSYIHNLQVHIPDFFGYWQKEWCGKQEILIFIVYYYMIFCARNILKCFEFYFLSCIDLLGNQSVIIINKIEFVSV